MIVAPMVKLNFFQLNALTPVILNQVRNDEIWIGACQ